MLLTWSQFVTRAANLMGEELMITVPPQATRGRCKHFGWPLSALRTACNLFFCFCFFYYVKLPVFNIIYNTCLKPTMFCTSQKLLKHGGYIVFLRWNSIFFFLCCSCFCASFWFQHICVSLLYHLKPDTNV